MKEYRLDNPFNNMTFSGAALGTLAGILIIGCLKIAGVSMKDIQTVMYTIRQKR